MSEKRSIGVPSSYFRRMAGLDYANWRKALAREFFQNSIDADASVVAVSPLPEKRQIIVEDDGCGMGYDTLVNRLLVLGGSEKKGSGSVGAFGKAKELLFFSWESYEILTQNWRVCGSGAEYIIEDIGCDIKGGTIATITLQEDEDFDDVMEAFTGVAGLIESACCIMVDGVEIPSLLRRDKWMYDTEWFRLYTAHTDSGISTAHLHVRVDGIWMFSEYCGDVGELLIIELYRGSLESLTSNRDALKGSARDELSSLLEELRLDRRNALHPPKNIVTTYIPGSGRVFTGKEVAAPVVLSFSGGQSLSDPDVSRERKKFLGGTPTSTQSALFEFDGYEPVFALRYQREQEQDVRYFLKTQKALILAKMWTETVRQVILDAGFVHLLGGRGFSVGFSMEVDIEACYAKTEDFGDVFYLNPWALGGVLETRARLLSNRRLLLHEMKIKAVHEVTHLIEKWHDESFMLRMQRVLLLAEKSAAVYSKIAQIRG